MKITRLIKTSIGTVALAGALLLAAPRSAQAGVFVSVAIAPPAIPVYVQPPIPGDGYIWTPGYWAWTGDGYEWVDGAWVEPPYVRRAVDARVLGLGRRRLLLERRLLGPDHRLLWRHQLRLRLLRHRLLRRILGPPSLLLQPRVQQLRWSPLRERLRSAGPWVQWTSGGSRALPGMWRRGALPAIAARALVAATSAIADLRRTMDLQTMGIAALPTAASMAL